MSGDDTDDSNWNSTLQSLETIEKDNDIEKDDDFFNHRKKTNKSNNKKRKNNGNNERLLEDPDDGAVDARSKYDSKTKKSKALSTSSRESAHHGPRSLASSSRIPLAGRVCSRCRTKGHTARECPSKPIGESSHLSQVHAFFYFFNSCNCLSEYRQKRLTQTISTIYLMVRCQMMEAEVNSTVTTFVRRYALFP